MDIIPIENLLLNKWFQNDVSYDSDGLIIKSFSLGIFKFSIYEVSNILLILSWYHIEFCIDLKVGTFGFTIHSDSFNNDANLFVLILIH